MNFIEIIDFFSLVDLISAARHRVYLAFPSIDYQLGSLLIQYSENLKIHVVIDNSEDAIRNGFGEANALEKLKNAGIKISECSDNLISFIIVDDLGYFLFPQSKIFAPEPIGPNAVRIDPITIQMLRFQYSLGIEDNEEEFLEEHSNAVQNSQAYFEKIISTTKVEEGPYVTQFDIDKFEKIKSNLEKNPPLQPDIKRILDVYTTKLQYVELVAKNIRITQHRASLPENSIPVSDPELRKRLISSIKAFENVEKSLEVLELEWLEIDMQDLRKQFLVPVKCRNGKSLIDKENLIEFKTLVEELNYRFKSLSPRLKEALQAEITKTKETLGKEWMILFQQFPPKGLNPQSPDFMAQLELVVKKMVRDVRFPLIDKIVSEFSLQAFYSELTWDDLKDEKLIDELCEKRLIKEADQDQIAEVKIAFELKK